MTKSNAERQANYRDRKKSEGKASINIWLDDASARRMRRLCKFYGFSQRQMIESMLVMEDAAVSKHLNDSGDLDALGDYLEKSISD